MSEKSLGWKGLVATAGLSLAKERPLRKPIVPEVCDRLKCNIPSCYGWDLCRQAREECTNEEWDKFWEIFWSEEDA